MIPFKYAITKEILATDDAELYAGYCANDRAPVTLKIPRGECPSPRQVARLKHEHAILQGLTLPGVLQAQALETWDQGIALVLEPFDGVPLDRAVRARSLSLREIVELGASVADALGGIHRRGVVHRAVRPENVLVADRVIKLIDFGAAVRASDAPEGADGELLHGALAYASPEQTGRVARPVDHRSDLYSLGVTLYQALTSALPFPSTDPMELIHSHLARTATPPQELSPVVPDAVSDIVMKLLAKSPDDRYQSAYGLKADLEECLKRWVDGGGVDRFELGRRDRGDELRMPHELVGRARELAALVAAAERSREGGAELVLLAGELGVGKSALVAELQRMLTRAGALFGAGRFDPVSRRVPYGPVVQPFRELCKHVLTERAEALSAWKQRLLGALGASGRVLAELIPELTFVIGPQPDVPELGPTEAQNRLRLALQDLARAFAAPERPIVLFLDDLQWADATSFELVEALLIDPKRAHLLVIGAYRDDEVDESHALSLTLARLAKSGAVTSTLRLEGLDAHETTELVADTLGCERERAAALAALVRDKTGGNPLFLGQLLSALRAQGTLFFDAAAGAWTWDTETVRAAPLTDNVVSFMARRLDRLSPAARRLLQIAACADDVLDAETLSRLSDEPAAAVAVLLREAQDEGLLLPSSARAASLRFAHDRVREAAYAALPEDERRAVHLRLGRLARARAQDERSDEVLFGAVRHLNLSAPLLTDARERAELARMNLTAGRRAAARTAYPTAARLFEAGIAALTVTEGPANAESRHGSAAGGFAEAHELAFALHLEAAESAHLSGQVQRAEALLDVLLAHARTDIERTRAHDQRVTLYLTQGRIDDALRVGKAALALLGIDLPADEAACKAAADAELKAARRSLAAQPIKDLLDAPEMSDDRPRAALALLVSLTMPAAMSSQALCTFIAAKQVNLSLECGHADTSAYGYMALGWVEARVFRRYEEAYELGTLALDLNERFEGFDLTCKLHFLFGACVSPFNKHLLSSLDHFTHAYEAGLRAGDLHYLSQTCVHTALVRISLGDECAIVRDEVDAFLVLTRRGGYELALDALSGVRSALDQLMSADAPGFDETAYKNRISAPAYGQVALIYYALNQQLCFLREDFEGALRFGRMGEAKLGGGVSDYIATELYFYTTLALLSPALSRSKQPVGVSSTEYKQRIAEWAERCPDNYRHKHLLIRAESSRAAGEELAAMKLYDQAIESAKVNGFGRDEALASELCAKFHLASGREKIAHLYMAEAYHGYLRWGATAKMNQLAKRYPHLVAQAALGRAGREAAPAQARVERPEVQAAMAASRAARTISGEIVLDRLLDRLLRLVLESAGAQRGVLLLLRDGALTVEAEITVSAVRIGPPVPIEAATALAISVVRYVARTQEPVVLGDATADRGFAGDPYIAAAGARSIMCLAMTHQGRLAGVLYLENKDAADAFSPAQLELCGLIASHAAIAVQNALLYAQVQETSAELRRGKDALEAEVTRRTEELWETNARLTEELAVRQKAEQERAALQEAVIRAQRDRLIELSAPLIPITDRIMVLPLIGEIDPARASQVIETTLSGAAKGGAAVVLIDVTGAKHIEASVGAALLKTAAALRLIGAQVVLTGIRPEAARALVELGVELSGIVTRGTLQSGLAHALTLVGGDARWLNRRAR